MIAFVKGILAHQELRRVEVDVNGIGYAIEIPARTADELPPLGSEVILYTHYYQNRDNEIKLYGFTSRDELKVFEAALTVQKVGPSLAQNIVSKLSPTQFQRAVRDGDSTTLMRVPRLNKEIAQLVIMKLRRSISKIHFDEKVDETTPQKYSAEGIRALMGLGLSEVAAEQAIAKAQKILGDAAKPEELIKLALREYSRSTQ